MGVGGVVARARLFPGAGCLPVTTTNPVPLTSSKKPRVGAVGPASSLSLPKPGTPGRRAALDAASRPTCNAKSTELGSLGGLAPPGGSLRGCVTLGRSLYPLCDPVCFWVMQGVNGTTYESVFKALKRRTHVQMSLCPVCFELGESYNLVKTWIDLCP